MFPAFTVIVSFHGDLFKSLLFLGSQQGQKCINPQSWSVFFHSVWSWGHPLSALDWRAADAQSALRATPAEGL